MGNKSKNSSAQSKGNESGTNRYQSRRKKFLSVTALVIAIVFLAVTVLGSFMYIVWADTYTDYSRPVHYGEKVSTDKYMRGIWVSSVYSLDYPSIQTDNSSKLKNDIDDIVKNCSEMGINTIFFQVRPTADALYKSDLYPWSRYLTGQQGKAPSGGFDPLKYFVSAAHRAGIELHAWINPYRITQGGDAEFAAMSPDNPANTTHKDYVVAFDGNYYFDPAEPAVRQLIIDGACEIARKYDVDGIHLDDYFYPGTAFDDAESYAKYGPGASDSSVAAGSSSISADISDIDDWRRNNVDLLIRDLDSQLHAIDRSLSFGISPAGIWENKKDHPDGSATSGKGTYSEKYCDSLKWIKEGWVDYIAPQIYWNIGYDIADYEVLLDWWSSAVDRTDVDLYIGMADYKSSGVADQKSPWYGTYELQKQMCLNGADKNVDGEIHFRYRSLVEYEDMRSLYEEWYTGKNAVSRDTPLDLPIQKDPSDPKDPSVDPEPVPEIVLTDIEGHWAENYIRDLVSKGIISGMGDGTFAPESKITRAQFVKMIACAAGVTDFSALPDAGAAAGSADIPDVDFTDVKADDWHRDYINWAASHGIVKGMSETAFAPDAQITREQMAIIIVNFAEYKGIDLGRSYDQESDSDLDADLKMFADASGISSWAADAVGTAAKAGIINGSDITDASGRIYKVFRPQSSATRAEAAKMIYAIVNL